MIKVALRIRVCTDDWAAESAIKDSNGTRIGKGNQGAHQLAQHFAKRAHPSFFLITQL